MTSRMDTMIRGAAGVTVVGLAGISGAISYSHMKHLAHLHGETGWRGHMFPLSVDGIEIVASLVLLADKRAGRRSGWLPWTALAAGTAASLAANVSVGGSDWIGRAVSGWPALAMLVAVKLLSGLLDHPASVPGGEMLSGTVPDSIMLAFDASGTVPVPEKPATATMERPDSGFDELTPRFQEDQTAERVMPPAADPYLSAGAVAADVAALLPAARVARQALVATGKRLTREELARQLRADGCAVSNARASALLKALASMPTASKDSGDEETA